MVCEYLSLVSSRRCEPLPGRLASASLPQILLKQDINYSLTVFAIVHHHHNNQLEMGQ